MNDYTTEIFNSVREGLTASRPALFVTAGPVTGEDIKLPAMRVTFSFAGEAEADSSGEEVWTETVVEAEAFSGTSAFEARSIIGETDRLLRRMGFRRSNLTQVPNADPSIRRVSAKWRALVGRRGEVAAR